MPKKSGIITFKAEAALSEALLKVPNRSEFIRTALLSALNNLCPLCAGTGWLSPTQKEHWDEFSQHHSFHECQGCHEHHLVCAATRPSSLHAPNRKKRRA